MPAIKLSITLEGEPELIMPVYTAVILAAGSIDIDPGSAFDPGGGPRWKWRNQAPKDPPSPFENAAATPDSRGWLDLSFVPNIDGGELSDLKVWLDAALRRRRPYALLVILGPPGSGKSTLSRILKDFIEKTRLRVTVYDSMVETTDQQKGNISAALAETPVIVNTEETIRELESVAAPRALYHDASPLPVVIRLTRPIDESELRPGIETLGFRL